jgi:urease accessory protein
MTNRTAQLLSTAALLALPLLAGAHPGSIAEHAGQAHGFADGFVHPFTGLDHLGAMLAVGAWSAGAARRMQLAPLAFALCLLAGALAAANGVAFPAVEPMIAFSLLAMGLLLANRTGLQPALASALMGAFALFHGAAHGSELGAGAALAGMLVATVLLLVGGIAIGLVLRQRSPWWTRGAGLMLAVFGVSLLAS